MITPPSKVYDGNRSWYIAPSMAIYLYEEFYTNDKRGSIPEWEAASDVLATLYGVPSILVDRHMENIHKAQQAEDRRQLREAQLETERRREAEKRERIDAGLVEAFIHQAGGSSAPYTIGSRTLAAVVGALKAKEAK